MSKSLIVAGHWNGAVPPDPDYTAGQDAWGETRRSPPAEAVALAWAHTPATLLVHPDAVVLADAATKDYAAVWSRDALSAAVGEHFAHCAAWPASPAASVPLPLPPAAVYLPWLRRSPVEHIAQVLTPRGAAPAAVTQAVRLACAAATADDSPHAPALSHVDLLTPGPLTPVDAVNLGTDVDGAGWQVALDWCALLHDGPAACDALAVAGCTGVRIDLDTAAPDTAAQQRAAVAALCRRGIETWGRWTLASGAGSREDIEAEVQRIIALGCTGLRVELPVACAASEDAAALGAWRPEPGPARVHPILESHELAGLRMRMLHRAYAAFGPSRLRALAVHVAGVQWAREQGESGQRAAIVQCAAVSRLQPFGRALERFAPNDSVARHAADVAAAAAEYVDGADPVRAGQERFVLARMLREERKRGRGSAGSQPPPADAWRLELTADGTAAQQAPLVHVLTDRAEAERVARARSRFLATASPA